MLVCTAVRIASTTTVAGRLPVSVWMWMRRCQVMLTAWMPGAHGRAGAAARCRVPARLQRWAVAEGGGQRGWPPRAPTGVAALRSTPRADLAGQRPRRPDDIDAINQRIGHMEQTVADLRLQLEERDDELAAARAANRELMLRVNAISPIA
jgi:hypothetical protein